MNDAWVINLRTPGRKYKIRRDRYVGQHKSVRFRRYEQLPCVPLDSYADPGSDPVNYEELNLLYSNAKKSWDARSTYLGTLREMQREYNVRKSKELWESPCDGVYKFNTIKRRKKEMFNEDEVSFIEETANRDLKALNHKIEQMVNEMARMGKQLSDLKVVESKLTSILRAIEEEKEDDRCRGAC